MIKYSIGTQVVNFILYFDSENTKPQQFLFLILHERKTLKKKLSKWRTSFMFFFKLLVSLLCPPSIFFFIMTFICVWVLHKLTCSAGILIHCSCFRTLQWPWPVHLSTLQYASPTIFFYWTQYCSFPRALERESVNQTKLGINI